MVAGLSKVLGRGALSIVASVKSSFQLDSSTNTTGTLRASVIGTIVQVVRHSLRVERKPNNRKRAASCAGIVRGGVAVRPSPAFR